MLKFVYSTMGGGKTTDLIKTYIQLQRKQLKPLLAKPKIDTREGNFDGWGFTTSRITSTQVPAFYFSNISQLFNMDYGILLLDEVQFCNPEDIVKLTDLQKDIIAYGLKTDVNGNLFPASAKLLALADEIREIPMMCDNIGCKNKAVLHSRYINGKVDTSKDAVAIEGGNITYKSLCLSCWKKER